MPPKKEGIQALTQRQVSIVKHFTSCEEFIQHTKQFTNAEVFNLKARFSKFDEYFNEFEANQAKLDGLLGHTTTDFEDFCETFYNLSGQIQAIFEIHENQQKSQHQYSPLNQVQSNQSMNAKLPTIALPQFSGSYAEWVKFRDLFKSLVHNTQLPNVQKFYYLKTTVTGEAAGLIESLELTEDNYEVAWGLITERFENKRAIIGSHMKALHELQALSKESYIGLRELVDSTKRNMNALKALGEPVESWDTPIVYLISSKFDNQTRKAWESENKGNEFPTYESMVTFLNSRCNLLEAIQPSHSAPKEEKSSLKRPFKPKINTLAASVNESSNCIKCNNSHHLFQCKEFLSLPVKTRISEVKKHGLCYNCLRSNHTVQNCFASKCRRCGKGHNTLLHIEAKSPQSQLENSTTELPKIQDVQVNGSAVSSLVSAARYVILSTAEVNVEGRDGQLHPCRALLDSGSQTSFVSSAFCERLQLPTERIQLEVTGIGSRVSQIHEKTNIRLFSKVSGYQTSTSCLVMPSITNHVPSIKINKQEIKIPPKLKLADPHFDSPAEVQMLLGADVFWDVMGNQRINLGKKKPMLQQSKLGWIVTGVISNTQSSGQTMTHHVGIPRHSSLEDSIERFWLSEEFPPRTFMSREETECEMDFVKNVQRDQTGRFTVTLPIRENYQELGASKEIAIKRFFSVERKLQRSPELRQEYTDFMSEYETLGHMTKVTNGTDPNGVIYYLPHHSVTKSSSTTTKTRVVFDASCKTTSNLSLNDVLKTGPTIQPDIFSIILRFRMHEIAMTADVEKMYRQVNVDPSQRNMQRIVWRSSPNNPLDSYVLNTLTYGTSPPSFLSTRCLLQLAKENQDSFPKACKSITQEFYVDDYIAGGNNITEAIKLKREVESILLTAGFKLRKWVSNCPQVLEESPRDNANQYVLTDNQNNKTLGISWNAPDDTFQYSIKQPSVDRPTKRSVLSSIAQIYDPMGLIGPIVLVAKLIMQHLWQLKVSWDEPLPCGTAESWREFRDSIEGVNQFRITRNVAPQNTSEEIILYGFSDASEKAFAACVYAVSTNSSSNVTSSHLLCAKSRVAPLKTISLPKLELNGALLLSRLIERVKAALGKSVSRTFCFTDSTVTLCWINTSPSSLKTFCANRVAELQEHQNSWFYVPSAENPADVLSRGSTPSRLQANPLWWNGPPFIRGEEQAPVQPNFFNSDEVRAEMKIATHLAIHEEIDTRLFQRYSSFSKLRRIIAYCLRFVDNCKGQNFKRGPLSVEEIENATRSIIKAIQAEHFPSEISCLKQNKCINGKSKLHQLQPYLDDNNILRVTGRLEHSKLSVDQKHPIILPQHHVTNLIIKHEHERLLHCGAQQLLSTLRLIFWPLSARRHIRKVIHGCMKCRKVKPKPAEHLMGQLPRSRVTPLTRPFEICGVDYAGPIQIRESRRRGRVHQSKAYIAIFVCFATKAVHIELVTDLTSKSFVAAIRRFTARRGICREIHSDNATTFVGAERQLREFEDFLSKTDSEIKSSLAQQHIVWKHIPPRSPHQGGLWEAAVKSCKKHFYTVTQGLILTYEECHTLLVQIEACLNCRPLCPASNDVSDFTVLTPSHFLIGDVLVQPVEPPFDKVTNKTLRSRWIHLQSVRDHFWRRWQREYLAELQTRAKWTSTSANLQVGDFVAIMDENQPPLHWLMGRVVEVHPGADGIVRVASVRTKNGIFKRAVRKLCPLPADG